MNEQKIQPLRSYNDRIVRGLERFRGGSLYDWKDKHRLYALVSLSHVLSEEGLFGNLDGKRVALNVSNDTNPKQDELISIRKSFEHNGAEFKVFRVENARQSREHGGNIAEYSPDIYLAALLTQDRDERRCRQKEIQEFAKRLKRGSVQLYSSYRSPVNSETVESLGYTHRHGGIHPEFLEQLGRGFGVPMHSSLDLLIKQ